MRTICATSTPGSVAPIAIFTASSSRVPAPRPTGEASHAATSREPAGVIR